MPTGETEAEGEGEDDPEPDADADVEANGEELTVTLCETLLEPLRVMPEEAVPPSEAEADDDTDGEPELDPPGLPLLLCVLLLL